MRDFLSPFLFSIGSPIDGAQGGYAQSASDSAFEIFT